MGLFVLALFLLPIICLSSQPNLRGVHPTLIASYQGKGGTFTCFDKSKVISIDQVNDNFCDCPDGSDEPGTSACPNGSFYCRNRGHEARVLSSAFVDDGICDCCDGSDEAEGCANTCLEFSASQRKALEGKISEYKQALDKKVEYQQLAIQQRGEMVQRAASIDKDIESARAEVEHLKEEEERIRKEEDERIQLEEEQEKAALEGAGQASDKPVAGGDGEAAEGASESGPDATSGQPDGSLEDERKLSAEELGRRVASQWTHDPEAALPQGGEDTEDLFDPEEDTVGYVADDHYGEYREDALPKQRGWLGKVWDTIWDKTKPVRDSFGTMKMPKMKGPAPAGPVEGAPGRAKAVDRSASIEAGRLTREAEERLKALEKEKEDLARYVTYDFGEKDEFLPLKGRCFENKEVRFTYKVCMFDKAYQGEGFGPVDMDLGTWKGFENNYKEAVFANGAYCWQAPNRSMRIALSCGLEEVLSNSGEPDKCVYTSQMTTPAACREEELKTMEDALDMLKEIERSLALELGVKHDEL